MSRAGFLDQLLDGVRVEWKELRGVTNLQRGKD
jgi:hypothetical protein